MSSHKPYYSLCSKFWYSLNLWVTHKQAARGEQLTTHGGGVLQHGDVQTRCPFECVPGY